ncbi:putative protein YeaC [Clostridium bornimense]|uniref:MoxR-like ATPase n=1 Tax=Clostridium bornimense TaxID=1216932 RepID=W6RUX5_9CLOT|nr:MoxR family ATPase [Clostridium bornimense]CDM68138.1 putative protein YeaC [Clostridium bornimense]
MNNFSKRLLDNISKVFIGKENEILDIIKGILAEGHILIEDVPGVGKTTLVKAIARTLDLSCNRIQFTTDLMPSDILGVSLYNPKDMEFQYKKGPIFANIILADEINRSTAKTQSALLQVMEEGEITEGNITYKLNKPFIVLATENPVEQQGVYNLPEAQLDRFIIKVHLGYPTTEDELKILQGKNMGISLDELNAVVSKEEVIEMQNRVKDIHVSYEIQKYIIRIVQATRSSEKVILGVSTRGSIALMRIAQAEALLDNRDYVIPEDVKKNAKIVLSHRIIKQNIKDSEEKIIEDIISTIPVVI